MAEKSKGNAGSAKPSGSVGTNSNNTNQHKLLAMGQTPKGSGGGSASKPGA